LVELVKALDGDVGFFGKLWKDVQGSTILPTVQPSDCRGQLLTPAEGEVVGQRISVRGRVDALPMGHHVWLVHRVDPAGLFWPKDFEVTIDSDGFFERHVYESGSGQIHIALILTTEDGSAYLDEWIRNGSLTGHYPGLPPTPTKYAQLAGVTVHCGPGSTSSS
jgi:hypothetical protein